MSIEVARAIALIAAIAVSGCGAANRGSASDGCRVTQAADLAILRDPRYALVAARIEDHDAALVVDTGSDTTMVTTEATEALGLARDPSHASVLRGVGGIVRSPNAVVGRFTVGDVPVSGGEVVVGHLPTVFRTNPPVYGLLGADVLARYDVDFDLPHGRLRLYTVTGCVGDALDAAFAASHNVYPVAIRRVGRGRVLLPVAVNGQTMTAILDSGASGTTLTRAAAARIGVTDAMLGDDPADTLEGIDQTKVALHRHRFTLNVGDETFRDQPVIVADINLGGPEMLLGVEFLRQRHLWISYATDRLFIQPIGPAAAVATRPRPTQGFTFTLP